MGRLFLLFEQRRQRGLGQTKGLDLYLTLRRSPAAAGARSVYARHKLAWQTEPRAGGRILDQLPADRLRKIHGNCRRIALQHAGGARFFFVLARIIPGFAAPRGFFMVRGGSRCGCKMRFCPPLFARRQLRGRRLPGFGILRENQRRCCKEADESRCHPQMHDHLTLMRG